MFKKKAKHAQGKRQARMESTLICFGIGHEQSRLWNRISSAFFVAARQRVVVWFIFSIAFRDVNLRKQLLYYGFHVFSWFFSAYVSIQSKEVYLEVKLPTIWTDGKAEVGRVREEKKRSENKKMQVHEKVGKSRFNVFFLCGSRGSKSNLAKAAGAEPAGQMRDEKVHAVVARSACVSKKAKNIFRSDHFWKLGCRKSARRCGAKHIPKPKVSKSKGFRALLQVVMSKKCTPLWREAHFQDKMHKTLTASDHCWKLRCRRGSGVKHISKSKV